MYKKYIYIYTYISYVTPKTSNWHPEIVRYRLVNIFTRTCKYMHMTVNNRLHIYMHVHTHCIHRWVDAQMCIYLHIYLCVNINIWYVSKGVLRNRWNREVRMWPHGTWPSASTFHMLVNLAKTCKAARNPMTSTSRRSPIAMIAVRRCMERGHPGSDMHISVDICIYIYI